MNETICHTLRTIKAWTKMIATNKITSVDKVVFSLVSYRLPFTLYPWLFKFFIGGGYWWYVFSFLALHSGKNLQLNYMTLVYSTSASGYNAKFGIYRNFITKVLVQTFWCHICWVISYTKYWYGNMFTPVWYTSWRLLIFNHSVFRSATNEPRWFSG